jgi:hypothetical protein
MECTEKNPFRRKLTKIGMAGVRAEKSLVGDWAFICFACGLTSC